MNLQLQVKEKESSQEEKQLEALKEAFRTAPSNTARAGILSVVPLSKQQIIDQFRCSRYLVDKSRQLELKTQFGAILNIQVQPIE